MMLTPSSSLPRSYVLASRAVRRIKAIDPTPSDQKAAILAVWISAVATNRPGVAAADPDPAGDANSRFYGQSRWHGTLRHHDRTDEQEVLDILTLNFARQERCKQGGITDERSRRSTT